MVTSMLENLKTMKLMEKELKLSEKIILMKRVYIEKVLKLVIEIIFYYSFIFLTIYNMYRRKLICLIKFLYKNKI